MWIVDRCKGTADAVETAIGYEPKPEDINIEGLDIDLDTVKGLLSVDKDVWEQEVAEIEEHYKQFGDKLPKELAEELKKLKARVDAL